MVVNFFSESLFSGYLQVCKIDFIWILDWDMYD